MYKYPYINILGFIPVVKNIDAISEEIETQIIKPLTEVIDSSFLGVFAYLTIIFHFYPFYQFNKDGFKKFLEENIENVIFLQ